MNNSKQMDLEIEIKDYDMKVEKFVILIDKELPSSSLLSIICMNEGCHRPCRDGEGIINTSDILFGS